MSPIPVTWKWYLVRRMNILVINSCGKAKKGAFDGQAEMADLDTAEKRKRYRKDQRSKSIAARDLYTGQQAVAVKKAVDMLRDDGFLVDYYIISAGFGLLNEYEEIPPYEASFTGLNSEQIKQLASNLGISSSISKLASNYDMIYLALGKNYFKSFNILDLQDKGALIVHYDRSMKLVGKSSFYQVNENSLIGNDSSISLLTYPVGNLVQSKGTILRNWAAHIRFSGYTPFSLWWDQIQSEIASIFGGENSLTSKLTEVVISSKRVSGVRRNNTKDTNLSVSTGYEIMSNDPAADKKAESIVSKLSDKEITDIYESHVQLNPRDAKRENRKEWMDKYIDREEQIKHWAEWFDDQIDRIQNSTGSNKGDARKALASAIRERQEDLGKESYLINPVRITLLSTFVSYLKNPEKLEESVPYQPRNSGSQSGKSSDILGDSNFAVKLDRIENMSIFGFIQNSNPYPMQSISLTVADLDKSPLPISEAQGEYFTPAGNEIHIPFIQASMTDQPKKVAFKITLNGYYDFTQGFLIQVKADDPAIQKEVLRDFEFT